MKSNIVFIGIAGSGKTTVGKKLAECLQMQFCDIDTEIEKTTGMTIPQYFAEHGEASFREVEAALVKKLSQYANSVISTGGGVVLKRENIENLRKKGVLVCLSSRPEVILERIQNDTNRPLLNHGDPYQNILKLIRERETLYQAADIYIDTSDLDISEVLSEIKERLKDFNGICRN